MKIIFATHNPNKLKEIQSKIGDRLLIQDLDTIGITEEIPETGQTLEENSLLKARYVYSKTGCSCFADDTGLEVFSLNNEPGVYSARYAGEPKNDEKNIDKLLHELNHKNDRKAQFRTVISLIWEGKEYLFEGVIKGTILTERRGNKGFGYDAIFVPEGYEETFAELDLEEKNKISHRAIAVQKLIDFLLKN